MTKHLLLAALLFCGAAKAQNIESISVNLYTDSLKKGTYNYINVDGLLANGRYVPLDSTTIIFQSSAGKFFGNSLFIDNNFTGQKVTINVTSRKNSAMHKEFDIYIKTKADNEQLKTVDELINEMKRPSKKSRRAGQDNFTNN
ncbi:MAG: hypothetical protein ABJB11_24375 [Ferruginibacter sp.]